MTKEQEKLVNEAIHKALKVLNCLNNDRVYETAWVKGALQACKEALEQPQPGNQKLRDALERYGKHDSRCGENVACIRRCDCGLEQVLKENT